MIRTIICILAFLIVMPPADVMGGNENKIALVMKALSNPFFLKMKSGAEE